MQTTDPRSVGRNYLKFMQWDITRHCNLNCAHCRSTEFYSDGDIHDLSYEDNVEIARELYFNGVRRIHFLGGEPLVRRDFCKFVDEIRHLGIIWSVNTNATLLNQEIAQRLLHSGARVITVSLDGPTSEINDAVRGKGVFEKVCENTERLTALRNRHKKPTRVVISCTLVQQNTDEIGTMVDLAGKLGVNSLILSSLQLRGSAKQAADSLQVGKPLELQMAARIAEKVASGNTQHVQLGFLTPIAIQYINEAYGTNFPIYNSTCGALIHKGYIQPDGALFPCQAITDKEKLPGPIGPVPRRSMVDHGFYDVWYSHRYNEIKERLFSRDLNERMLPCHYCKYFRHICYPCPLGIIGGGWSVHHLCLAAMAKLAEHRGVDAPWRDLLYKLSSDGDAVRHMPKENSL